MSSAGSNNPTGPDSSFLAGWLLALDTCGGQCATGVFHVTGDIIKPAALIQESMDRGHAERLVDMIGEVLHKARISHADIGRMAVTVGPGSFTGVRIGLAAARGLALSTGAEVVGVGTLEAIALTAAMENENKQFPDCVALDARRDEVFTQAFHRSNGDPSTDPFVAKPDDALAHLADTVETVAGTGAPFLAECAKQQGRHLTVVSETAVPDLEAVALLGARAAVPATAPDPMYVRAPDAKPQSGKALPRR